MTIEDYFTACNYEADFWAIAFKVLWFKSVCKTSDELVLMGVDAWRDYELKGVEIVYLDKFFNIERKEISNL